MRKVVGFMHLTFDGVMQAPGQPDGGDRIDSGWAVS